MKKRTVLIVLSVIAVFAVVCMLVAWGVASWVLSNPEINASLKQLNNSFSDMLKLQQDITAAYPAEGVNVNIQNGHILTLSLVNSDANKLAKPEQAAQAKEIAAVVKKHYARISDIDTIRVALIQQNGAFGISLNFTNSYAFELSELP